MERVLSGRLLEMGTSSCIASVNDSERDYPEINLSTSEPFVETVWRPATYRHAVLSLHLMIFLDVIRE